METCVCNFITEHVRESKLSSNLVCKWEGCSQTVLRLELVRERVCVCVCVCVCVHVLHEIWENLNV